MTSHHLIAGTPPGLAVEPWARCPVRGCRAPIDGAGNACTGAARHPRPAPRIRMYATWTSTARNLSEMHHHGVRLLTGPDQLSRYEREIPPLAWALDNGAWGCHQRGAPFDDDAFARALERWGAAADWIVLPDIVAGGLASLDLSMAWLDRVRAFGRPAYLAVQDGIVPTDIPGDFRIAGLFVGGSTAWKWGMLGEWGAFSTAKSLSLHVGRVNSARMIRRCIDVGATSCDGTSPTLYGCTTERLAAASRTEPQMGLALEC